MKKESLFSDLLPFVDIGAPAPKISQKLEIINANFIRNGRTFKLKLDSASGKIELVKEGFRSRGYASLPLMFASEDFASLRRWADTQADLLRESHGSGKQLPINGRTHTNLKVSGVEDVNNLLCLDKSLDDAAEVLLIDGPAGIGKTHLVEQLAFSRADTYKSKPQALILHVKSRGRILSNIQDLMAFSLQTLRSNTTYDQVPVLLRHGLVIIAIDGFDELGDPNGYELAWTQVNDLIHTARGKGVVLLSGRDTFLGRDRLFRDVTSLRQGRDVVTGLTLEATTPTQAQEWLRKQGWTTVHFETPAIATLLESDSFALRPMFLKMMAENLQPKKLREEQESFLTPLLVKHMLKREASLFGKNVEAIIPLPALENFLLKFLIEVARDMADSQSEAMDDTTLSWIVELSLEGEIPDEIIRLIRNRANVIAALCPDIRPGFKSFVHSHLYNYFLSLATIQAVADGGMPKFVKRNVFGSEFVAVFGEVAAKAAEAPQLHEFVLRASTIASLYSGIDRAGRNLGSLLFACLSLIGSGQKLNDCEVDETVVRGTAGAAEIQRVSINQLDCRGADLRSVVFVDCKMVSVIASEATRFSSSFPIPRQISLENGKDLLISTEIEEWLSRHGRNASSTIATGLASPALKNHSIFQLLERACRVRQYWLRLGDDKQADRILSSENWPPLADILRHCQLIREEVRQASGRSSTFTHVRLREKILAEDSSEADIRRLFEKLNQYVS